MEITFRQTRPDEMGLLCDMDVRIFGDDGFNSVEDWEGLVTYFIIVDGQIAGSIAMRLHTGIAEDYEKEYVDQVGSIYIASTGILQEWQGQGIGSVAKAWEIDYAKSLGFTSVVTNARASNYKSINLNLKHGFKIIRTISDWYGDEDAVVMKLTL